MIEYNTETSNRPQKTLSEKPLVTPGAVITHCKLGTYTEIMGHTTMVESTLDDYSYICGYCSIIYCDIGKFSNIASQVRINPGNHPMERPTLHHFTYRSAEYGFSDEDDHTFFNWRRLQRVSVGHDTWIGHGAVIMPGVTIGNGAIVGSNSVVTRNVPAYTIVGGSPAKVIRRRFPELIANRIEASAWWDWDHQTLKQRLSDFRDLRVFLEKYCSGPL